MSMVAAPLPTSGTFPINVSSLISEDGGHKKRKADVDEYMALRYAFKPGSITQSTPGILDSASSKARSITFDVNNGSQQVFEVKEEISKPRECVLIWDEATRSFNLYPLSTTLNLTLNRSASTSSRRPTAGAPSKPPSTASSSSSSSSIPLAQHRPNGSKQNESPSSGEQRLEVSSLVGETDQTPKATKVKPIEVIPTLTRPTKGGKSLPRKTIPARPVAVKSTPGKGKGGSKKHATKAPPTPKGKLSAETIEDSDEDYGLNEGGEGEDAEDEFAKMVGESLAADGGEDGDEGEEDEDEDEDDDEGDELGGATLVVRNEGRSTSGRIDDTSEWL